ncbi:MAG: hypothetical protein AAGI30_01145 [Planctomycetota bacterium]
MRQFVPTLAIGMVALAAGQVPASPCPDLLPRTPIDPPLVAALFDAVAAQEPCADANADGSLDAFDAAALLEQALLTLADPSADGQSTGDDIDHFVVDLEMDQPYTQLNTDDTTDAFDLAVFGNIIAPPQFPPNLPTGLLQHFIELEDAVIRLYPGSRTDTIFHTHDWSGLGCTIVFWRSTEPEVLVDIPGMLRVEVEADDRMLVRVGSATDNRSARINNQVFVPGQMYWVNMSYSANNGSFAFSVGPRNGRSAAPFTVGSPTDGFPGATVPNATPGFPAYVAGTPEAPTTSRGLLRLAIQSVVPGERLRAQDYGHAEFDLAMDGAIGNDGTAGGFPELALIEGQLTWRSLTESIWPTAGDDILNPHVLGVFAEALRAGEDVAWLCDGDSESSFRRGYLNAPGLLARHGFFGPNVMQVLASTNTSLTGLSALTTPGSIVTSSAYSPKFTLNRGMDDAELGAALAEFRASPIVSDFVDRIGFRGRNRATPDEPESGFSSLRYPNYLPAEESGDIFLFDSLYTRGDESEQVVDVSQFALAETPARHWWFEGGERITVGFTGIERPEGAPRISVRVGGQPIAPPFFLPAEQADQLYTFESPEISISNEDGLGFLELELTGPVMVAPAGSYLRVTRDANGAPAHGILASFAGIGGTDSESQRARLFEDPSDLSTFFDEGFLALHTVALQLAFNPTGPPKAFIVHSNGQNDAARPLDEHAENIVRIVEAQRNALVAAGFDAYAVIVVSHAQGNSLPPVPKPFDQIHLTYEPATLLRPWLSVVPLYFAEDIVLSRGALADDVFPTHLNEFGKTALLGRAIEVGVDALQAQSTAADP